MDTANDTCNYSITFEQYEAFCASTAVYRPEIAEPYLALGLNGEVGELIEKLHANGMNLAEELMYELGDSQWYAVRLCTGYRFDFEAMIREASACKIEDNNFRSIRPPLDRAANMAMAAGKIADKIKKRLRDGEHWGEHSPELQKMVAQVRAYLVLFFASSLAFIEAINLEHRTKYSYHRVLTMNRNKLQSRKDRGTLHGTGDHR